MIANNVLIRGREGVRVEDFKFSKTRVAARREPGAGLLPMKLGVVPDGDADPIITVLRSDPSLGNDERGLIISPPFQLSGGSISFPDTVLNEQDLRLHLLMWDRLDKPIQQVVEFPTTFDERFLIEEGILTRTELRASGKLNYGSVVVGALQRTFQHHESAEPGKWALATGATSSSVADKGPDELRSALVRLHRAIPVPVAETPIQEILAFKARRRPELLQLRGHLDDLYARISASPDPSLAETSEFARLCRAVDDLVQVSIGSRMRFVMSTIGANLSIVDALAPVAAFKVAFTATGSLASGGYAAGGAFSLRAGIAIKDLKRSKSPLEFTSRIHRDLSLPKGTGRISAKPAADVGRWRDQADLGIVTEIPRMTIFSPIEQEVWDAGASERMGAMARRLDRR